MVCLAAKKPFVKWVGGKRQLLDAILARMPLDDLASGRLHYAEPFVGGGAVFFELCQQMHLKRAVLNDLNGVLMAAYRAIQQDLPALLLSLQSLERHYLSLPSEESRKAYYLEQRDIFNVPQARTVEQAARLIFLNKTCFNGLYRENSKGGFNVPFGKRVAPLICDEPTLRADSLALHGVHLLCGDFAEVLDHLTAPTLVYLDPPYKPISQTSSFNSYTKEAFDDEDQERLATFCRQLTREGHRFILSNSDPGDGYFDRLYDGFTVGRVLARRNVNADPTKRGVLSEVLITNL